MCTKLDKTKTICQVYIMYMMYMVYLMKDVRWILSLVLKDVIVTATTPSGWQQAAMAWRFGLCEARFLPLSYTITGNEAWQNKGHSVSMLLKSINIKSVQIPYSHLHTSSMTFILSLFITRNCAWCALLKDTLWTKWCRLQYCDFSKSFKDRDFRQDIGLHIT